MSLNRRRRSTESTGARTGRRRARTVRHEDSECFSDEVDIDVARRLHSLHVSSLALYEVYFGYSDDQVKVGSPSVVSSCSEVPGSPTRFPGSDYRRKRNALKSFRKGRKKKKMDHQSADWMEVAEAYHTRGSEMPEKGGNPLLRGHRFNPLTRGKQKQLGSNATNTTTTSKKRSALRQLAGEDDPGRHSPRLPPRVTSGPPTSSSTAVVDNGTVLPPQGRSACSSSGSGIVMANGELGISRPVGPPGLEPIEDMDDESRDSFASGLAPLMRGGGGRDSEEEGSELSETADEQGREADDEESSFEVIPASFSTTTSSSSGGGFCWIDRDLPDLMASSEEDENIGSGGGLSPDECLGSILHSLQPIMTTESWRRFTSSVKNSQAAAASGGGGGNKRQQTFKPSSFPVKRYFRRPPSRRPTEAKLVWLSPEEMNVEIVRFLRTSQMESFRFPLMSRKNCLMVCNLARLYGIQFSTSGESKVPVAAITLYKTADTHLADQDMVKEKIKSFKRNSPSSLDHVGEGQEVATGVPPIQDTNLGHRMLESLGWEPGQGLGRHENGIVQPVPARMKRSKSGLGF